MAEKTDLEAGASPSLAGNEYKNKPGCCENPFPEDKEAARAWGEKMKKRGIAQMGAAVACTGGLIGGVGGGTGNWGAAVGGACGLFFGLGGGGMSMLKAGKRAIAYANGEIAYPF